MVGIDIIEVERINYSHEFMNKIAHQGEIEYIEKSTCESLKRQRLAALFCVKEAVMKALEMGAGSGVVFKDIELKHQENGKPFIELYGKALEKLESSFKSKKIEVSLSHTEKYATAFAMIM